MTPEGNYFESETAQNDPRVTACSEKDIDKQLIPGRTSLKGSRGDPRQRGRILLKKIVDDINAENREKRRKQ